MNLPKRVSGSSRFTDAVPSQLNESTGGSKPLSDQQKTNGNSNNQGIEVSEY
jgi:hypothetical protein